MSLLEDERLVKLSSCNSLKKGFFHYINQKQRQDELVISFSYQVDFGIKYCNYELVKVTFWMSKVYKALALY